MHVQIKICDVVLTAQPRGRMAKMVSKELAVITLPTSHEYAAMTMVEFAEGGFSMGLVSAAAGDYYAGIRAMYLALLSSYSIVGAVKIEAKIIESAS